MRLRLVLAFVMISPTGVLASDAWQSAQTHAEQSRKAIQFCRRYAHGWLAHADPVSGLLPRRVDAADQRFWNAKDCAADNYPFLTLVGEMTDDYYLKLTARHIFAQEQKLTIRVDSLPDDFGFAAQAFVTPQPRMPDVIFGAAEYAKDGLIPITEWVGPGPWSKRMADLICDIWKHAEIDSPLGKVPTTVVEVDGDLLQAMSRMYWLTGDARYREWAFRLAELYLFHRKLTSADTLRLVDHGCEVIGGLSEAYVIAARTDPARRERFKPELHAILDYVLQHGRNEDGMMFRVVNVKTGQPVDQVLSDGWGYVYDAFLTVADVDGEPRYRDPVLHALCNATKYVHDKTPGFIGADQLADSVEGAINLLNRLPVEGTFDWVDREMECLFGKQQPDGTIERWYGDGNSARTAMMYALCKTQGITASPWRDDLQLGASRDRDDVVRVFAKAGLPWSGRLRCDRPRHRDYLHLPLDYARINQFPEWFTVELDARYELVVDGLAPKTLTGRDLLAWPCSLEPGKPLLLTIRPIRPGAAASAPATRTAPASTAAEPGLRTLRYTRRPREQAVAWQNDLRLRLARAMRITDLGDATIPLNPVLLSNTPAEGYSIREVEFNSTPGRRLKAIVTVPATAPPPGGFPAVVCIHGHGGNRRTTYEPGGIYKGFAAALAANGYVTIAADVGQHAVYEPGRTLMGERLWDLMRCVDFLLAIPTRDVDARRIGCAGLSLGGEMAMWLGAMDPRIQATVSCGFLTRMDQMEHNHCMCWKFDGLRELVDFADIYALIAPRPLQCQNGLAEPPTQFAVDLARPAMGEIKQAYADFGVPGYAGLVIHPGAHEVDLDNLVNFFKAHLGQAEGRPASLR